MGLSKPALVELSKNYVRHGLKVISMMIAIINSPTSLNSFFISLLDDACNMKMIIPLRPRRYDFINEPKL